MGKSIILSCKYTGVFKTLQRLQTFANFKATPFNYNVCFVIFRYLEKDGQYRYFKYYETHKIVQSHFFEIVLKSPFVNIY